jgi:predicted nucleic acid-binding protein
VSDLLIDSDVFIDMLRGARGVKVTGHAVWYSVITRAELFAGRDTEEQRIRTVLSPFREISVDRMIAERGGALRRTFGMGAADALIAATALEHRLELVTRNVRDFKEITGLRVRDPSTM